MRSGGSCSGWRSVAMCFVVFSSAGCSRPRLTCGVSFDERTKQFGSSQILAGRPFQCFAEGIRCDERELLIRVQRSGAGEPIAEIEVPWSSDMRDTVQDLQVKDSGDLAVRLLCDATPVATAIIKVGCVSRPENVAEWISSSKHPGCLDQEWVCSQFTLHWYAAHSGVDPSLGVQMLYGGDLSTSVVFERVYKDLMWDSGCAQQYLINAADK